MCSRWRLVQGVKEERAYMRSIGAVQYKMNASTQINDLSQVTGIYLPDCIYVTPPPHTHHQQNKKEGKIMIIII